jgi:hypothetical protein
VTDQNERVMYVPPKSMSFGHAARARNAREAWNKTRDFLERNALYELRERTSFVCPRSGEGLDEAVRDQYLSYVRSALGPEGGEPGYPSWSVRKDQFEECVELALDEDRWPRQRYGPAHFHFCYDFVWRREGATRINRDRAPNEVPKYSWLGISIGSGKVFLQPSFFFPFPFDSGELPSMLITISADVPFKFSPHHFQRVFASKEGRCYNRRKLPNGWLQSAMSVSAAK